MRPSDKIELAIQRLKNIPNFERCLGHRWVTEELELLCDGINRQNLRKAVVQNFLNFFVVKSGGFENIENDEYVKPNAGISKTDCRYINGILKSKTPATLEKKMLNFIRRKLDTYYGNFMLNFHSNRVGDEDLLAVLVFLKLATVEEVSKIRERLENKKKMGLSAA